MNLKMKNKNSDLDSERYRNLIQKMESRKNKQPENSKPAANLVYMNSNMRTGSNGPTQQRQFESEAAKARFQTSDDQRIKKNFVRPDLGRIPNSAKNYRNEQQKAAFQQQYFRRNPDTDARVKNENLKYQSAGQDNRESLRDKKFNKQFQNVLYNAQKGGNAAEKVESNSEYEKLHLKLDHIENKISEMKSNLQRKKEQKRKMLENQKKQAFQIQQKNINQKSNSLGGLVTQVQEVPGYYPQHKKPYTPNHNVYYVSQIVRVYRDEKSLGRQHLFTSLQVFRMLQNSKKLSDQQMLAKRVDLPRRKGYQNKKTVVFDLDETLIHCNENLNVEYDVKLPIKFPTGEIIEAGINIRPYCRQILKKLSEEFQIIVFTASHSCYASVVLDHLDPKGQYIHHRLYREHCHATPEGIYIKDLRIMNRDLSEVVLVDNAAYSYAFQVDNGIPILPYYHGSVDFQLQALEHYIKLMVMSKDVRKMNRMTFKLDRYPQFYDQPQRLVEELYLPVH